MKSSRDIRKTFLDFFSQKLHQIVPSAPIVVQNDPTLMFTNAGMNQFKDSFLGLKTPSSPRIADTQKCLRVSGKHNDLEEVGHDTYHHTMFEMLGNWSFGNYYKEESISWAWELLTKEYGLPEDRLYATVFAGDQTDGLGPDLEAENLWKRFLPAHRIIRSGKKDNFWEMGDTGPAGPCSEIHVDLRPDNERQAIPGEQLVNRDHPQVVEIWNLVFIQYERRTDTKLYELPDKHVDTGMGFERLAMALQGKQSTYDIDLFLRLRQFLEAKTGILYESATQAQQVAMRVVMDHIRAIVFTIADGQIPSNTGAGYVIRRILRRASRYAYSALGLQEPFLHELVALLAVEYDGVFPEVKAQQSFVARIIEEEEKGFLRKLDSGTRMFDDYLAEHAGMTRIEGAFAFKLYDTFGFPIDLTQLMARERGLEVDMEGFESELQAQKTRSRQATQVAAGDWVVVKPTKDLPVFRGYDLLRLETEILQFRTVKSQQKEVYQVVLAETPFYAESGGQIGDTGTLTQGEAVLQVLDTQRENELIIHLVDRLPADASGSWIAQVNGTRRADISANHSATHLMHAALRQVLGTHVEQRGSLVSDQLLRFDFSHFSKVTEEELAKVEEIVNEKIAADIALTEYRGIPIAEAKAMGAMALFGEKYGEVVRTIVFDPAFSVELCGGTHVPNTSRIRLFTFSSEGSVAAGIRRVEALTGSAAIADFRQRAAQLDTIAETLKSSKEPVKAVEDLTARMRELEKELARLVGEKVARLRSSLLEQAEQAGDLTLIRSVVDLSSADDLKQLSFELKQAASNAVILLGATIADKAMLSLIFSDDLAATNRLNAGQMIRELAKHIQGGGGGQPFYATAGGKNPAGLEAAMEAVKGMLG